jgi:hypothetical protein
MKSPRTSRIALAALCCCLTFVAFAAFSGSAAAKDPKGFVIHEWGTFSTFSGSNGAYLKFYPNDRDLPGFVYNRHRDVKGGLPDAYVSLETPVMYFYSDRDRTVSVQVDFPKGLMTDWYPQASRMPTQTIRWDNIKVTAESPGSLIAEKGKGRYFAARETDAAVIQVTEKGRKENEKFLFYRGVGDFSMPFTVRALGKGAFTIKNTGKDAIPGYFLVRVDGAKVYFTAGGHISSASEVEARESTTASTSEKLGEAVASMLVEQGLYEKEAKAMVKTWSADWFGEDGVRVIYMVPEAQTAEFLPARISPKPDQIVRVLVGRHDILTPEREGEIDGLVKQVNSNSNAVAESADRTLNKMGRYRWAAQAAATARLKPQSRR